MADLVPTIREFTSEVPTVDAAGVLHGLHTDIVANSSLWRVDDANTTTETGDEGITLSPTTGGEDFQVNLRNKAGAAIIAVSIQPGSTITDAGDSTPTAPTGTDSDWSDESDWDVTATDTGSIALPGSKFWVVETTDHIAVFVTDSTNATQGNAIATGRIYVPIVSSDVDGIGQDGLAMLVGKPDGYAGSAGDWLQASPALSKAHYETNLWGGVISNAVNVTTAWAADGTDGENNTFAHPIPCFCDIGGQNPFIGVFKYWRVVGSAQAPKTVKPVATSNQGWLHIDSGSTSEEYVYLWDKTVTP